MANLFNSIAQLFHGSTVRPPVTARHVELSAILSADDEPAQPSDRLIDLALQAANRARSISMTSVTERMKRPPFYPDVWPGEHYKLLAALVQECKPRVVIEIGTAEGMSALALHQELPPGSTLHTFDIIPWKQYPNSILNEADFIEGSLSQVLADVCTPSEMKPYISLFHSADIIFVDGPKDGRFERLLLERFEEIGLPQQPLIIFDDIRLWNMLDIWRGISRPKLDVTSFGHWSGTGLVDWT